MHASRLLLVICASVCRVPASSLPVLVLDNMLPGMVIRFRSDDDGFCECEDVDVRLCDGEIRARLLHHNVMDEDGYYESNPLEVDLCPIEVKERRYKMRRGITADSGAGDSVIPRRMINNSKIKPSAGSKRGLHYVSATDQRIPNVGEISLDITTTEGHEDSMMFQVADVNKPLMSISDRVDNRCRVTFDQDDVTGEDLTHTCNKKTKKIMKLRRVGKVWGLDCTVAKEFLSEGTSVFSRRGP